MYSLICAAILLCLKLMPVVENLRGAVRKKKDGIGLKDAWWIKDK